MCKPNPSSYILRPKDSNHSSVIFYKCAAATLHQSSSSKKEVKPEQEISIKIEVETFCHFHYKILGYIHQFQSIPFLHTKYSNSLTTLLPST